MLHTKEQLPTLPRTKLIDFAFLMNETLGMDPPSSELLLSFYLLVAHHNDNVLPLLLQEPWHTPDLLSGDCTPFPPLSWTAVFRSVNRSNALFLIINQAVINPQCLL